ISSGRVHLANPYGSDPPDATAWGWTIISTEDGGDMRPKGDKIGWLDGDAIYLDPDASYATAQRLARDQNDALPVSGQTLWKRLKEKGYLASVDAASQTNTVRHTLEGKRRHVLHFAKVIFVEGLSSYKKPDQPSQDDVP